LRNQVIQLEGGEKSETRGERARAEKQDEVMRGKIGFEEVKMFWSCYEIAYFEYLLMLVGGYSA